MNVITQIIKLNNMRIKLLLITAFSALCLNAMAQQEFFFEDMKQNEPKVAARIGFVGGFNLSTLTWDPNISSDKFGMRPVSVREMKGVPSRPDSLPFSLKSVMQQWAETIHP